MDEKELLARLDKLRQDVDDMPSPTPDVQRVLQGIEHAIYCLTSEKGTENE